LPSENFSKKTNSAEKSQTDYLNGQKKPKFGIAILPSQKNTEITIISLEIYLEIEIKSSFALYWSSLLLH